MWSALVAARAARDVVAELAASMWRRSKPAERRQEGLVHGVQILKTLLEEHELEGNDGASIWSALPNLSEKIDAIAKRLIADSPIRSDALGRLLEAYASRRR